MRLEESGSVKKKIQIILLKNDSKTTLWIVIMSLLFALLFIFEFAAPVMGSSVFSSFSVLYSIIILVILTAIIVWVTNYFSKKKIFRLIYVPVGITVISLIIALILNKLFKAGAIVYVNGIIENWNKKTANISQIFMTDSNLVSWGSITFIVLIAMVVAVWTCYAIRSRWNMPLIIFNFVLFAAYSIVSADVPIWAVIWMAFDMVIYAVTIDSDVKVLSKQKSYYIILAVGTIVVAGSIILAEILIPKDNFENMQRKFVKAVEESIFGKSDLTDGDLTEVGETKNTSDEVRLLVEGVSEDNVYLKGFTGASYDGTRWEDLDKEAYSNENGSENESMLQWMSDEEFWSPLLLGKALEITDDSENEESNYTVVNKNASSKYFYMPYGLLNDSDGFQYTDNENRDQNLKNDVFNKISTYTFKTKSVSNEKYETLSDSKGALSTNYYEKTAQNQELFEFLSINDELSDKEKEKFEKALKESNLQPGTDGAFYQCEIEYRKYTDKYYMDVSKEAEEYFDSIFGDEKAADIKDSGVYSILEFIRNYFEKNTVCTELNNNVLNESDNQKTALENNEKQETKDFVVKFLNDTKTGYSVHYASAATLLFRYFGIPSRYVEGYLARGPEVKASDAHAWVEVYRYGFGWVPIEVTPGYYDSPEDSRITPLSEDDEGIIETESPQSDENFGKDQNNYEISKSNGTVAITITIIVMIILAIIAVTIIRREVIVMRRKKKLEESNRLMSIKNASSLIVKIAAFKGIKLDECRVKNSCNQMNAVFREKCSESFETVADAITHAHYSQMGASKEDQQIVLEYMNEAGTGIYKDAKVLNKILMKYILVLV